jgi:photosystem II stability/assembly factor-like uncharacterized protein
MSETMIRIVTSIIVRVLCFLVFCPQASAQWYWQNPLPQGNSLSSVMVSNPQTAWVSVFGGGSLLRTTDRGSTWDVVRLPVRIYTSGVYFVDDLHGWAAGQYLSSDPNLLFGTSDGGQTWVVQMADSFASFEKMCFLDENRGWAGGRRGRIHFTSNGGISWQLQADFPNNITGLSFVDEMHGWAVNGGLIRYTTDGGSFWQTDSTFDWVSDVSFVDSAIGWICGNYKIASTSNGGQIWRVQLDTFFNWVDVYALDTRHAWAVSETGQIAATSDDGDTWILQDNPTGQDLNGVTFIDSLTGFAVGVFGTLLSTSNGGATWENKTRAVTTSPLFGLFALDGSRAWATGDGGTLIETRNGGTTWEELPSGISERLSDVFFVSPDLGWAVGKGGLIHTTDGGESWSVQSTHDFGLFADIEFTHYPIGWIISGDVGTPGKLIKTTDGGNNWLELTNISLPFGNPMIQFTSADVGWIMIGNSTISGEQALYRTTSGGEVWQLLLSNSSDTTYESMSFVNDSVGWVSTFPSSIVFHTTDAGTSWERYPTPWSLTSVFFLDETHGFGGDVFGEIYRTNDAGRTWEPQLSPLTLPITGLHFADESTGWAFNGLGNIVHTSNGGTSFVDESVFRPTVPRGVVLGHNYPNPFNSQTTILFRLFGPARTAEVQVFDILGRRVRVISIDSPLVGENRMRWDGRDQNGSVAASGVYFYSVTVDRITKLGRMIIDFTPRLRQFPEELSWFFVCYDIQLLSHRV